MIIIFLILDILGNYYFHTLFTLSYIISISYLYKYNFNMYYIIIIGLIYDLIFNDILFLNSLIFYLIYLFIKTNKKSNIYLLGFFTIFIYYLLLSLIEINNYSNTYLLSFLIINYLIFLVTYYILKRIYNNR